MSYRSWIRAVKSVKPLEVLEEAAQNDIVDKLVAAGMGKMSKNERVSNQEPPLSNDQFVALIKKTFTVEDQIPQVTVFKPLEGSNVSHSFSQFGFTYDGKIFKIILAGGSKGRGTKQTNEQETSWLLVLSALYHKPEIETANASQLFDICHSPDVYSRVYGNDGKVLDEGKAVGLVKWMENNGGLPFDKPPTGWVNSHIAQCKDFISKYPNTPKYFRKDKSGLPIVKLAKQIFPTSVPDQTFDKDKWNPADVWLEYEDVPTFSTLTQLNNYLEDSLKSSSGILGVSLKKGTGLVDRHNIKGERPEYEVTDFKLHYGDFFAQNVSSKYDGNMLEGYSVTYRLFTASSTETIRGEAQKKKSLAAHGKVYLKYMDFILGRGRIERTVESVKGILVKEKAGTDSGWELTKEGIKAFNKIKRTWPLLRDSDIMKYGRDGSQAEYDVLTNKDKLLDAIGQYARKNKKAEKNMQTRISARFQTIALGTLLAAIKRKNVDVLHKVALGMLLYGKSESDWSAPHAKAQ